MHCTNDKRYVPRRQRGFTLLLTMLVLLVGGASVYLSARNPAEARIAQSLQESSVSLRDAAMALAVYSISDNDRPGSLPCPDDDSDGAAELFGGSHCPTYTGRLPWRTIDTTRDAGSFWYVMDPGFRDHADVEPLNVGELGSLSIDGVGGFAALVILPGDPIEGQTGRPSESISDYLDIPENTDGDDDYVDCTGVSGCNDRIIGISVDQLMAVVQQRALAEVERALRQFHADNDFLPFAARFDGGSSCDIGEDEGRVATSQGTCGSGNHLVQSDLPSWIADNDWLDHIVYSVDLQCTEVYKTCENSNMALKSHTGLAVVLAGAGTELSGQDRSSGTRDVDDYLDSAENTDGDGTYDDETLSRIDNDVFRGFAL